MPIHLDPDTKAQALASIKRLVREELEQEIGDLKAMNGQLPAVDWASAAVHVLACAAPAHPTP